MKESKRGVDSGPAENPFEARWAVLAGTSRKRAASAAAARSKRNVFADRRIGEDDPSLPEDERYLARLQRERTRRSRKRARFSLADGEEDHGAEGEDGAAPRFSLLRDDYDDTEAAEDAAEEAENGEEDGSGDEFLTLKEENGEDNPNRVRTHQEIMDEVVLKSKMHKAKRQQEKFASDEQTAKLDEDLSDIMALLSKSSNDFIPRQAGLRKAALVPSPVTIFGDNGDAETVQKEGGVKLRGPPPPPVKGVFRYEHVYRQLAEEKRARPSDRLLTEEEKAEKEMKELMKLEGIRNERMRNADGSEDEQDDPAGELTGRKNAKRKRNEKKERKRSGGDDLDDGFDLADIEDDRSELSELSEPGHPSEQEVKAQASRELKEGNLDRKGVDLGIRLFDANRMVVPKAFVPKIADEDIPFVFKECPSGTSTLQALFENKTVDQRNLVMERLRKCFAVSLNPAANTAKLDRLVECLLLRIEILSRVDIDNLDAAVKEMDMLLCHVHVLGKTSDVVVSAWARDKLAESFSSLASSEVDIGLSRRWKVCTVLVLRGIGRLFPASDLRHPVSTPLVLLLAESLSLARMKRTEDVAMGVLVSNVLLEQMAESGRYCGQLSTFLCEVLRGVYSGGKGVLQDAMKEYREDPGSEWANGTLRLAASDCMKASAKALGKRELQGKVLHAAMRMIEASSFAGRVRHTDLIYKRLPLDKIPDCEALTQVLAQMRHEKLSRQALSLYTKETKAVVSKTLNPKFSAEGGVFRKQARTSYAARRGGDVSASATRVRRALRKEERGLARDVRRAAGETGRERARIEQERARGRDKRGRELMAFLEEQQAGWKKAAKRQKQLSGKKW